MSSIRKYSFYIDEAQAATLKHLKERDGVLESEQIRRAIDDWIEKKGVTVKRPSAARQRDARSERHPRAEYSAPAL
jgi:ribbon-helix-helix protein